MTELIYRFRLRRGTAAALAAANETPQQAELYYETDQGQSTGKYKLKIGDGVRAYNTLPYMALGGGVDSVVAGTGIAVNSTDPKNPIVSSTVAGVALKGRVATYAALPSSGNTAGDAYLVDADQRVYVWSGTAWPTNGSGLSVVGGTSFDAPGLIAPLTSIFTAVGTGLTTANKTGRMVATVTSVSGPIRVLYATVPAAPYTLDLCTEIMSADPANLDAYSCGILLSDGTKYETWAIGFFATGSAGTAVLPKTSVDKWTSQTSFSANTFTGSVAFNPNRFYLRITSDGTTRKFFLSSNGQDFIQIYSEAENTYLTATRCGISFYNNSRTSVTAKYVVHGWKVTNSVLGDAT